MSDVIWWKVYVFKNNENRILLNRLVKQLHSGAPQVLNEHINSLTLRKRKAVIQTKDGYELTLTRGETKTIDGTMHYQIFVDYTRNVEPRTFEQRKGYAPAVRELDAPVPAPVDDYGLAEFDRISSSLAHSAPVAEAIRAIQREEVEYP